MWTASWIVSQWLMHAFNINVAECSRKSVKIYALKEYAVSTAIWLQHSVENRNEERQVRGKKNLDLNFVGLVTMRKISGCDSCEWCSATGLWAALWLNWHRCQTHFSQSQASCEPSNATNGNPNSSLTRRKREIWSCNFLLTNCFKDSNNQSIYSWLSKNCSSPPHPATHLLPFSTLSSSPLFTTSTRRVWNLVMLIARLIAMVIFNDFEMYWPR